MKKSIVLAAFLFGLFAIEKTEAQVRVNMKLNIGSQPVWGPTGYDHVEYYYLPDIDAYYYVPRQQYVYLSRGRWVFASKLPRQCNNYDINTGYKVVINERNPYRNAAMYREKYGSYKGRHDQETIRNSHEPKYFENKNHPEHAKWKKQHNRRGKSGRN